MDDGSSAVDMMHPDGVHAGGVDRIDVVDETDSVEQTDSIERIDG